MPKPTTFILQKKPPGAKLFHSIAYILLILLTYIASIVYLPNPSKIQLREMEDFHQRTLVTLAPDLVILSTFWNCTIASLSL